MYMTCCITLLCDYPQHIGMSSTNSHKEDMASVIDLEMIVP